MTKLPLAYESNATAPATAAEAVAAGIRVSGLMVWMIVLRRVQEAEPETTQIPQVRNRTRSLAERGAGRAFLQ